MNLKWKSLLGLISISYYLSFLFISFISSVSTATYQQYSSALLRCLSYHSYPLHLLYTPNTSSFTNLLKSSIQNPRFYSSSSPLLILAPNSPSQVQASLVCSKSSGIQLRVLSGGHDYEGISYLSDGPFVIVYLLNLREVNINIIDSSAWVQSGATIGELYYRIAEKSDSLAFPAGLCPTVGVGGLLTGGGMGTLMRKYGVAADNVVDASIVDVHGRILDRKSMGENLFWAIRGGGGGSFGIVLSWKIRLVRVPPIVTVFTVVKSLQNDATGLVNLWQGIGHRLDNGLFVRVLLKNVAENGVNKSVQASFNSLFLGRADELLQLMAKMFPELGLKADDCKEMSWINSALYFAGYREGLPKDVLLSRESLYGKAPYFKGKSDFVTKPIPEAVISGIWDRFLREDQVKLLVIFDPLGGRMDEISEYQTPFPHRRGNLYNVQYFVRWSNNQEAQKHIDWLEDLYSYMEPYVSNSPRAAYVNYRDLSLGVNMKGQTTNYGTARVWGEKYFKNNFMRLAKVKAEVDGENFFRNEQSIPPWFQ